MYNPQASFRNILSPVTPEEFFAEFYDKKPLHIPGDKDKFAGLCDWNELSRLLDLKDLWTAKNLILIADRLTLPAEHYCAAETRDQATVMVPDRAKVESYLEQGSTMVLNYMETFSGGADAIANAFRLALGWPVEGNLYCSWKQAPGFRPHFDITDVFALHFEGEKTWDIYATRFEFPFRADGFHYESFPHDFHDGNRGEKEMSVEMKAGDVLYIPKGKYHAAQATSDASLHVTFGIKELRGIHCVHMISDALLNDPFFRRPIPSFLNDADVARFIADIGERVAKFLKHPGVAQDLSGQMRGRAWESIPSFAFPMQSRRACYRVQTIGTEIVRNGAQWQLQRGNGRVDLTPADAEMAKWMLLSDAFDVDDLEAAFPVIDAARRGAALERLAQAGLIFRL